jgi:hypothetical protein
MNIHDGKQFTGLSGDTAAFTLRGGKYSLIASGTITSVGVEMQAPDGAWVSAGDPLTETGMATYDLPPGQARIAVDGSAVAAALVSVPA